MRRFSEDNETLAHLSATYRDSFVRLRETVPAVCARHGNRYVRLGPQIRRRMLQAHIYADLAQLVQKHQPRTTDLGAFESGLVAWRALDAASAACAGKAQRYAPPGVVITPFELVEQHEEFRLQKAALRCGDRHHLGRRRDPALGIGPKIHPVYRAHPAGLGPQTRLWRRHLNQFGFAQARCTLEYQACCTQRNQVNDGVTHS